MLFSTKGASLYAALATVVHGIVLDVTDDGIIYHSYDSQSSSLT